MKDSRIDVSLIKFYPLPNIFKKSFELTKKYKKHGLLVQKTFKRRTEFVERHRALFEVQNSETKTFF